MHTIILNDVMKQNFASVCTPTISSYYKWYQSLFNKQMLVNKGYIFEGLNPRPFTKNSFDVPYFANQTIYMGLNPLLSFFSLWTQKRRLYLC